MKILMIFCFSLILITAGVVYAAAVPIEAPKVEVKKEEPRAEVPQDFKKLADVDLPDYDLADIASRLTYADLGRFEGVSKQFQKIAEAEFKNRLGELGYLWAKGEVIQKSLHLHEGKVIRAFATTDGSIISVGTDHQIYVWQWDNETKSYKTIRKITDDVNADISYADFSAVKNWLVLEHVNHLVNVWDVQAIKKINHFNVGYGNCLLSSDGSTLAVIKLETAHPTIVDVWDLATGASKEIDIGVIRAMQIFPALSPDGKKLALQEDFPGPITIWNLAINARENKFKFDKRAILMSFLPDGKLITYTVDVSRDQISIWDVQLGKEISTLDCRNYDLGFDNSLRLSHGGSLFAVWFPSKGKIVLWHAQSGKVIRELDISCYVRALDFTPDDKMIIAGCVNGDIMVWQAKLPEKKEAKSTK